MKKITLAALIVLVFLAGVGAASLVYTGLGDMRLAGNRTEIINQPITDESSAVTRAVKTTLPSVVTVGIDTTIDNAPSFQFDPFNPFGAPNFVPGGTTQVKQNIGSGFIVSANGLIVTNKHVVSDTTAAYKVITNDGKKYTVSHIYRDPLNDLAVLQIPASGLKPLSLGDSSHLVLGQLAIAIGTPLGQFQNTVTVGVISGLGRGITAGSPFAGAVEHLNNVIQTDAAINPGNSGGPLLNAGGQAIGINTAVASQGQNIGFAIPINVVRSVLTNFKKNGSSFSQAYLGVRYSTIAKNQALMNNTVAGAYIAQVIGGSPAEKAGIRVGDIITGVDGARVGSTQTNELSLLISEKKAGQTVRLTIWRNNTTMTLNVTLATTP
ncbi:trypsin-like peptidase domain-containing protein [Patescibacteria group bacterium]|nr:trypsin-like peptidase domain-containing protein [Patescibacteria group bacterium]